MEKKLTNKIVAFEYILYKLNEWYKDNNGEKENDLSILKAMKLLFFVSGVDVEKNLLSTFDNFQAWQYGHVEADVYKEYSKVDGNLSCLKIDRNKTIFEEKIDERNNLKYALEEFYNYVISKKSNKKIAIGVAKVIEQVNILKNGSNL